jgi:electron transport complex protein RnfD
MDGIKTRLGLNETVSEIRASGLFGTVGGLGWEWINLAYLIGGLALLKLRVIQWHIPASLLGSLFLISLVFYLLNPDHYTPPDFQLFSGATMLAAFFIATDPVSASTTPRGRLLFGAGIGLLVYIIRTWGGYPDGVAFAVLLMNMAAPVIDHYTQPRVFGHDRER